jgi:ribose/xylose/arabinose/galactoside ABC-type transport system permease subunit
MMVYWLALLLALGTFALVYRLLRSCHGLALSALGDRDCSRGTGVDVFRTKFLIYVLTAVAPVWSAHWSSCRRRARLARRCLLADRLTAYVIFITW